MAGQRSRWQPREGDRISPNRLHRDQKATTTASEDGIREACGVIGVYHKGEDVARVVFFGLFALQHRGQESAGICVSDGARLRNRTSMGLVTHAFAEDDLLDLPGHIGIGHTRYSTTGSSRIANAQPMVAQGPNVELALGHNGNIINAEELRQELEAIGCEFVATSDSEIIAQMIANAPSGNWPGRIAHAMRKLRGAYSLTILTKDAVIGVRDPLGVRPLCVGRLNGGWVIASESCALDHVGATYVRDVDPGEAVIVDDAGFRTLYRSNRNGQRASCIFENIYFARPDSLLNGQRVYTDRMRMGAELAREFPVEADMVIGVPDSATAAAVGYSQESGIPFGEGLVKNRYVGRTFIEPDQRFRDLGVRRKLNPLPELIEGKRLVVVDDSIVRGTTTPHVVSLLRRGGAKAVHLRICAPPIISTCHFGVDLATKAELIAANRTVAEVREFVDADSLGYLSISGLVKAVEIPRENFCLGCFTGEYPIPVQLEMDKLVLEAQAVSD